jgi:hypothetical protein
VDQLPADVFSLALTVVCTMQVVARDGKRVKAYVYHMEEVDNEQPVQGGRWREL